MNFQIAFWEDPLDFACRFPTVCWGWQWIGSSDFCCGDFGRCRFVNDHSFFRRCDRQIEKTWSILVILRLCFHLQSLEFLQTGHKKKPNSQHAHMLTANTLLQYGSGKLLAFKQLDPYRTRLTLGHWLVRVWWEVWAAETSRSEKVAASWARTFRLGTLQSRLSLSRMVFGVWWTFGLIFCDSLKNKNPILH